MLPEEALNLRYVAVTRAESECPSGSWSALIFAELEAYRRGFPQCLLIDSLEQVIVKKPAQKEGAAREEAPVPVTELGHLPLVPDLRRADEVRTALVRDTGCPTCPKGPTRPGSDGSDTKDSGQLLQGEASTPNASEQGFSWNLGAVDPEQVRMVVGHDGHRYPALDLSWLLQSLAELRVVGEPWLAVTKLIEQQQLESAERLVERFLLDMGLWVVAGEELTLP